MFNWVFLSFWLVLGAGLMFLLVASLEIWPLRRWWRKEKRDEQVVFRVVPD